MTELNENLSELKWFQSVPLELHGHRKKLEFFIDALDSFCRSNGVSRADISVLEVGCSNGRNISLPLAERGYRMTGIDIHLPSIEWAVTHSDLSNARFICQDFAEYDDDELFDAVVLSDILEHVEEPSKIINLALKHLKPDGLVLVCIPNGYGPFENEQRFLRITRINLLLEVLRRSVKRLLGRRVDKQTEYNYDSGHVQFFSMREMRALIDEAGLQVDSQANGSLFGGDASYALGILMPFIIKPSLWLADHLPSCLVSTWYFRLSRHKEQAGITRAAG